MSRHQRLRELGAAYGIAHGYHDIWGGWHEPGAQTLAALLGAQGIDTGDDAAIDRALAAAAARRWRRVLEPVQVARAGEALRLPVVVPGTGDPQVEWTLTTEDGAAHSGEIPSSALEVLEARELDGTPLRRVALALEPPALGYHRLEVRVDGGEPATLRLVIAPARCHLPDALAGGTRVWGVTVQLYALRSARNWGMGDLGDLRVAVDALASLGADLVGLNPLHAPFLDRPESASPYSPSSRRFLNPLYLDVEALEDFATSPRASDLVRSAPFGDRLAAIREAELVDHRSVAALKLETLELVHADFHAQHVGQGTEREQAFEAFRARSGEALRRHAIFEALGADAAWHGADPASADPLRVELHEYLQWQCAHQLEGCAAHARDVGMRVGLYMDLAVGADAAGAEIWSAPQTFATGASIGAPPDDFSPTGQVWNLPPWRPEALVELGYEPFIETLRAAMRSAGALRIDHVVGLLRQFWVPAALAPGDGAYVAYPLHDLLSILALESERHACVVVGEDLGTVPDEMRAALHEHGVLSYRVLYFERHWHGDHSFKRPQELPADALVTVSTHDLPTLAGFWTGHDLELRDALGLLPGDRPIEVSREHRAGERAALLAVLEEQGLVQAEPVEPQDGPQDGGLPFELALAVHCYVARAPSLLMSVQIEDVLGIVDQANVPGTVNEQPNWRRRITLPVERWASDPRLVALSRSVGDERG